MKLWNSFRSVFQTGVCLSLFLLPLTGCGSPPVSRDRVIEHIDKECGISGYSLSDSPKKALFFNYRWTVTEKDGTQFLVIDHYDAAVGFHEFKDNFNSLHLQRYLQGADCSGFTLHGDVDDFDKGIWLEGGFTTRRELHRLVDRLNALAADCPSGLVVPYWLKYDHPFRAYRPRVIDRDYGDMWACTKDAGIKTGEKRDYDDFDDRLLSVAVPMRYEDRLREFTPEEIRAYVKSSDLGLGVVRADGSFQEYDDLVLEYSGNSLALPTVYEVLKREAYPVSGSPQRFSFKGLDGSTYEFSPSFMDLFNVSQSGDFYCLKDGRVLRQMVSYGGSLLLDHLVELTGIVCKRHSYGEKKG